METLTRKIVHELVSVHETEIRDYAIVGIIRQNTLKALFAMNISGEAVIPESFGITHISKIIDDAIEAHNKSISRKRKISNIDE
jgi:hypothetical protein